MPVATGADLPLDPPIDLTSPRVIHVIGVGGPGMSPIATVLAAMGHTVSGTDIRESAVLDRLRSRGVSVIVGHDPANIPDACDLVVISTAIPSDNVEVVGAIERSIPVVGRSPVLRSFAAMRRTIAIAGTHGKTTTSSMLAVILRAAEVHPSFIIGGEVLDLDTSADWDAGAWFVMEADESDGSGFSVPPEFAVVTNIEPDHLEYHGSVENLHRAFADFMESTTGRCIVCVDDGVARRLGEDVDALTYGQSDDADYRIVGLRSARDGCTFGVEHDGQLLGSVHLPLPGVHNALNACAAIAVAFELGIDFAVASDALGKFGGVGRRFQNRGEAGGVVFIDDYAHLPAEIMAAVSAARDGEWRRVVAVFQPHRYSRTEALWREFADAFDGADILVLTDIYAAGESPREGVSGKLIVDAVLDSHGRHSVTYIPDRTGLATFLASKLRPGDLCLTLGAGDLTDIPDEVRAILSTAPGARP
jgi:UDP-N-acetylmuramate--alanine ligase